MRDSKKPTTAQGWVDQVLENLETARLLAIEMQAHSAGGDPDWIESYSCLAMATAFGECGKRLISIRTRFTLEKETSDGLFKPVPRRYRGKVTDWIESAYEAFLRRW